MGAQVRTSIIPSSRAHGARRWTRRHVNVSLGSLPAPATPRRRQPRGLRAFLVQGAVDVALHGRGDHPRRSARCRPGAQGAVGAARPQRVVLRSSIIARQRVRDDRGGGGQVVLRHVGRDAASKLRLPTALASSMLSGHLITLVLADGAQELPMQLMRPESAGVEAQRAQADQQPGTLGQRLGGLSTARAHTSPRLRQGPASGAFFADEAARGQHHGQVGGRRAARHRRDGQRAVGPARRLAVEVDRHATVEVEARSSRTAPRKRSCASASGMRSCGREEPGDRPHGAQVESMTSAYAGACGVVRSLRALRVATSDATCSSLRPVGAGTQASGRPREWRCRCCRIQASCSRCVPLRGAQGAKPGPALHKELPTTPLARSIWADVSATSWP